MLPARIVTYRSIDDTKPASDPHFLDQIVGSPPHGVGVIVVRQTSGVFAFRFKTPLPSPPKIFVTSTGLSGGGSTGMVAFVRDVTTEGFTVLTAWPRINGTDPANTSFQFLVLAENEVSCCGDMTMCGSSERRFREEFMLQRLHLTGSLFALFVTISLLNPTSAGAQASASCSKLDETSTSLVDTIKCLKEQVTQFQRQQSSAIAIRLATVDIVADHDRCHKSPNMAGEAVECICYFEARPQGMQDDSKVVGTAISQDQRRIWMDRFQLYAGRSDLIPRSAFRLQDRNRRVAFRRSEQPVIDCRTV